MVKAKKTKLVVAINDFRIGGAQKVLCDVMNNLDKDLFDIYLVTLIEPNGQDSFYDSLSAHVHVVRFDFKGFTDWYSWRSLYTFLKQTKPDVVWSNLYFSNTVVRCLKIFVGYKVVVTEHNTYRWKTLAHRVIDSVLARVTTKIVTVSKTVAEYTAAFEWITKSKFIVIPNGIDYGVYQRTLDEREQQQVRKEFGWTENAKIIISVGQFIKQKNHQLLIAAFSEFVKNNPDYRLLILGDGSLRPQLERQIKDLQLEKHVALPGIKKDLAAYYAASEFFVLPSLFEGFGIVCIEAMAAGLPVIATKVAGPTEYIANAENGYLSDTTKEDFLQHMNILSTKLEQKPNMFVERTKKTALSYDITVVVKEYERLLSE